MAEKKTGAAGMNNGNSEKPAQPLMNISASPHIRSGQTTTGIMADVLIALLPASIVGVSTFGMRAALMILICVTSCMVFEYLSQRLMKRPTTVRDLSAAVTGLLIALNLPVSLPFWMAILGCLFAIVLVKQLFGGIGQNFMNPALAARCFLVLSFVGPMTRFTYDAVTTATPLMDLRNGGLGSVNLWSMFLGNEAGTIGETSAAALLLGALYLLIRRVIRLTIPVFYMGTFAICILIYGLTQDMELMSLLRFTAAHLTGGGLVLGACFMATDYTTSPITEKGKVLYGILLGLLTFCFRIYGSSTEGVSYAIIISNLLVPMIEMITKPRSFGKGYEDLPLSDNRGWIQEKDQEKKKEGPLRIVVTICLIAVLAGGILGAVYAITKGPIAETAERKKQESYKTVMPEGESYQEVTGDSGWESFGLSKDQQSYEYLQKELDGNGFSGVTVDSVVNAEAGGEVVGQVWIVTSHEGYAGEIRMAVGVKNGRVTGVTMLAIGETTGLGMEARDNPAFTAQYVDKDADQFTVVKTAPRQEQEIQAITGATITSRAVTNAVNAVLYLNRLMDADQANSKYESEYEPEFESQKTVQKTFYSNEAGEGGTP